jgi:hypothetical protein
VLITLFNQLSLTLFSFHTKLLKTICNLFFNTLPFTLNHQFSLTKLAFSHLTNLYFLLVTMSFYIHPFTNLLHSLSKTLYIVILMFTINTFRTKCIFFTTQTHITHLFKWVNLTELWSISGYISLSYWIWTIYKEISCCYSRFFIFILLLLLLISSSCSIR